ncbi:hypothetical protein R4576_18600, partial [Acinetobacter baumannii]|nr:hypothetical protein [Acinetobacter baumannii]
KVAGASQWSTLTSSAALYNNTAGWYKAGLNTLENNTLYDYQYLAYNAKGEILGGGQGIINTALNQATVTQKALAATDLPSVYIDKKETVNTKQDIVNSIYNNVGAITLNDINTQGVVLPSGVLVPFSSTPYESFKARLKYTFYNGVLSKYNQKEFAIALKNPITNKIFKVSDIFSLASGDVTNRTIEISTVEFDSAIVSTNAANYEDSANIKLILVYKENQNFIPITSVDVSILKRITYFEDETGLAGGSTDYPDFSMISNTPALQGSGSLNSSLSLRLTDQLSTATQVVAYYRELGSNKAYTQIDAKPLMDVYGQPIVGAFDINFNSVLDTTKKYEIQYVALAGKNIVNRQQGIIEFTSTGMQVNTTPLNYGGDGFILFSGTDVQFIDQFKPVTSTSTSAKLKIRKVGTTVCEQFALTGTSDWFSWNGNQGRDGEYEFQLDSFNGTTQTMPSGSIIGKLRLGSQPKVLSYIPKSFAQNQITFAGQPIGSSQVTIKYGTAAGQLNKT